MDDSASPPAPPVHTRAIRSYALREDAVRARDVLAENGIAGTIREYRVPDPVSGQPVTRGCSLLIDPRDAAAAARLLLRMPPSDAPAAAGAAPQGPSKLRRRSGPPVRQKSTILLIGFAILSAAGMMIFSLTGLFGPKKNKGPVSRANVLIEEDLNGDTIPDVIREFTWNWIPLYHAEDRNFDSLIDHTWLWQHGKPAYRDIDLNYDGKVDERTTYDPEGQPFYIDTRPGSSGPVLVRKVFRDGILWKLLEDRDADSHFDHLTEYNDIAEAVRETELPGDSPENQPPVWPPPAAPENPEEAEGGEMRARP